MYRATPELPVYVAGASSGLNNMPVVRFDGHQQFCGVLDVDLHTPGIQALNTPFTLFAVVKNYYGSGSPAVRGFFGGGIFGRHSAWPATRTAPKTRLGHGRRTCFVRLDRPIHSTIAGTPCLHLPDMSQRHWAWYRNGTAAGSSGLTSETPRTD